MPVRLRKVQPNKKDLRLNKYQGLVYINNGVYEYLVLEERRNKNDKWTPVEVMHSETT